MKIRWLAYQLIAGNVKPPSIGSVFDKYLPLMLQCPSHGIFKYDESGCPMCDVEAEHFISTGRWT